MNNQGSQLTNTSPLRLPEEENGKPAEAVIAKKIKVTYCLYARKSSEDDERQALSIDSQTKEMAIQGKEQGLRVSDIREESHSAKISGKRPVFNQIIEDIRAGLFNGILSWAPDRLSRNAGDLGALVDLMDSGYLTEIRTHGQIFTNSPNDKFLLMILCSQAKLENDNRGINVKRGMKTKCELGFRPNMTPLGYVNDYAGGKGRKRVFVDKERAPIIKRIFERCAYEGLSGRKIYTWLKDETDFRSRKGNRIALSVIYKILNNPYYCGMFEFPQGSGKWYKGAYKPIISRELFDAVQKKMEVAPKSKPGTKIFDFTRMFKCGNCESGITAQEKIKNYKNGTTGRLVYYHCTKFKDLGCRELYIRKEKVVEDLTSLLNDRLGVKQVEDRPMLKLELEKFQRLSNAVLGINDDQDKKPKVNLPGFIRYIMQEGTREEKRELVSCLNTELYIQDRAVITKD